MVNLNGLRASGKTLNLVLLANKNYNLNKYYNLNKLTAIITPFKKMEEVYFKYNLNKDIPIITMKEYLENKFKYENYDLFVDELEYIMASDVFTSGNLKAYTSDKENLLEVKRQN